MNVLFLTTHLNTGGITSYLLTLSKGLLKQGMRIHVISSGGNMEKTFVSCGVHLSTIDILTKSELSPKIYIALGKIKKYIFTHEIQIIHTHTRITQVMGALLSWMTKRPMISTCHGFFKTRLSRKLVPCWGQAVIAISEPVRQHLINDFHIPMERVELIQSGIDLDSFRSMEISKKSEFRIQLGLRNAPVIGMIARLSDVKGQDILVRAMKEIVKVIPETQLLFIGEGKLARLLKNMVKDYRLEKNIFFHPINGRTSEMLGLFDVIITPSRQEGLGLSVMEAQAFGLPVIASNIGGIPQLITHNETGILVEPENPQRLAEAVIDLLQNTSKQKELGQNAKRHAEKNYSSQKMIAKIKVLYEKYSGF